MVGDPLLRKPSTSSGPLPPIQTVAPKLSRSALPERLTLTPQEGSGTRSGNTEAGGFEQLHEPVFDFDFVIGLRQAQAEGVLQSVAAEGIELGSQGFGVHSSHKASPCSGCPSNAARRRDRDGTIRKSVSIGA